MTYQIKRSDPLGLLFDVVGGGVKPYFENTMKVDIVENNEAFVLHADLPGVDKEKIKVEWDNGMLSISVEERKEKETKEGERILRMERSYSRKERAFNFGDSVNYDGANAKYDNGVLILNLPKKVETKESKRLLIE